MRAAGGPPPFPSFSEAHADGGSGGGESSGGGGGESSSGGEACDGHGALGHRSGSAYVFSLADGRWQQSAKLIPQDGTTNDYFNMA